MSLPFISASFFKASILVTLKLALTSVYSKCFSGTFFNPVSSTTVCSLDLFWETESKRGNSLNSNKPLIDQPLHLHIHIVV